MWGILLLGAAVRSFYNEIKQEVKEEDFWRLTSEQMMKLPKDHRDQTWYMLNPDRLAKNVTSTRDAHIVSEEEKCSLLRAVVLIKDMSNDLPSDARFSERLLYIKKMLPPVMTSKRRRSNKVEENV